MPHETRQKTAKHLCVGIERDEVPGKSFLIRSDCTRRHKRHSSPRMVRLRSLTEKIKMEGGRRHMRFRFFLMGWSWWRSDETGERGKVLDPKDTTPLVSAAEPSKPPYDARCSCCRLHIPHSQAVHIICSTPLKRTAAAPGTKGRLAMR
jgi:hypothetical protein